MVVWERGRPTWSSVGNQGDTRDCGRIQTALPRKRLGRSGYQVSVVSVGGWLGMLYDPAKSGTGIWGGVTEDRAARDAAAIAAVRRAIILGINYFDTAPMYGGGEAERLLGVGLQALSPVDRHGIFISSKVGAHPERPRGYDTDTIRWSFDRSLQKLHTQHLDIVFIHDPGLTPTWIKCLGGAARWKRWSYSRHRV